MRISLVDLAALLSYEYSNEPYNFQSFGQLVNTINSDIDTTSLPGFSSQDEKERTLEMKVPMMRNSLTVILINNFCTSYRNVGHVLSTALFISK